ncbi:IS3 family transposase, partial [Corynebacterium macginleyi]|nr:IS3 family transposase [Corynebacterium macginleyi]
ATFDDEHGLYGAKRIAASLNSDTDFGPINHKKVARIMKSMGLKGFTKRRRCITTRRKPGHRVMPDLVGPQIHSQRAEPRLCWRHYIPAVQGMQKHVLSHSH